MSNKSRSILQEISQYVPSNTKEEIIESRADHIISSVIHLMEMIEDVYDEEEATLLEKRLLSSIRNRDPKRFNRVIKKLRDS